MYNTTQTLNMPKHITSLASSGVIISVRQTVMTFTKSDNPTGERVSAEQGANTNLYRVQKDLFSGNVVLKGLLNHRQTVYNWLKLRLYPWNDGQFYCPVQALPSIRAEYDALVADREKLKAAWGEAYDDAIGTMVMRSNSVFKRGDYPSKDSMLSRFTMDMQISEVPVGDFRNAIANDLAQDLFNNLSRQHERAVEAMLAKQCSQLLTVMESLSHCCELVTGTDKDGNPVQKRRKLYDSTVNRALEYVSMFEEFNLAGNADLEAARSALGKALSGVTVERLRESDTMRVVVKESVDEILSMFRPKAVLDDAEDFE